MCGAYWESSVLITSGVSSPSKNHLGRLKMAGKSGNRKTVMLCTQTYVRLSALKTKFQQIVGKKMSMDETLQVVLSTRSLDGVLEDMILAN